MTKRTPSVSIVMPVRNAAAHLADSLDSLWRQTMADFEVVVVDDGSTDATSEVLEAVGNDRLRVVKNAGAAGIAHALNAGIAAARAPLIARMDADDVCLPNRLARQVALLEHEPDLDAVGSDIAYVKSDGTATRRRTRLPTGPAGIALHLHIGNCLPHPTVVARRRLLEQHEGYRADRPAAEDYDLWIRATAAGAQLANIGEPLLLYRQHPANTSALSRDAGAHSVSSDLSARVSSLLGRAVRADTMVHVLLPNAAAASGEKTAVLQAVDVATAVALLASRKAVSSRDAAAIQARAEDVVSRLLASSLRHHPRWAAAVLLRSRELGILATPRGFARRLAERRTAT